MIQTPGSRTRRTPIDRSDRSNELPRLLRSPVVWVLLVWTVIARDVLARGDLLEPAIFGLRVAEKPSLLSWLIAGTARLTGTVDERSARLPVVLAVLGTALLVQHLVRRNAGAPAALFAAATLVFCPLVLRKLTISEPDTLATFCSFAAFVVWWEGEVREHVTVGRWLACGGLLVAVAIAKGPQPLGFFVLGIGGYLVVRRRWAPLPGFALCVGLPAAVTVAWATAIYRAGDFAVWLAYLRRHALSFNLTHYLRERVLFVGGLPLDLLPSTILLPSILMSLWIRAASGAPRRPIRMALALYVSLCTLVLLVWPGARTRYAMPIAPAVAVMAGLAFDQSWRRRQWAARVALGTVGVLFVYQIVLVNVALSIVPERFDAKRQLSVDVDAAIQTAPAPLFTIGTPRSNQLFYVKWPIQGLTLPASTLAAPAWVLAPRSGLGQLEELRPNLIVREVPIPSASPDLALARIERRPVAPPRP
jgi:4-amino-4-deoxy-L-arabinose transferase-like glycosyltransferase